jgi:hypothetical protein
VSVPELFRRLAVLDNSLGVLPGVPARPRALWYGTMLGAADNNPANLGDPYMTYLGDRTSGGAYDPNADSRDYEERDWILGQVANILTVRSDTFTAYILIRTQDATPTGGTVQFRDKRLVAIFDRSNVFLPPALANNGSNDSGDAAPNTETAALLASDPNYRDREYVRPRIVAIKDVTD